MLTLSNYYRTTSRPASMLPFSPVKKFILMRFQTTHAPNCPYYAYASPPPQYMLLVPLTRALTGPQWLPPHPKCNNLLLECAASAIGTSMRWRGREHALLYCWWNTRAGTEAISPRLVSSYSSCLLKWRRRIKDFKHHRCSFLFVEVVMLPSQ